MRRPIAVCLQIACGGVLTVLALHYGYRAVVAWPATPMTVARAETLFGQGTRTGQTIDEVEEWLASQGVVPEFTRERACHSVHHRPKDSRDWFDSARGQTVVEWAGLSADDVHSFMRVSYPDA